MAKKDEAPEEKQSSARGRIMQVVEVEEEVSSPVAQPVSPEKMKHEQVPEKEKESEKKQDIDIEIQEKNEDEKPDIASSFPMPQDRRDDDEEEKKPSVGKKEHYSPDQETNQASAIPPLKPEAKMDLVSELFETNRKPVEYPEISLEKKSSPFKFLLWVVILLVIVGLIGGGLWYLKQRSVSQEPVSSEIVSSPTPTLFVTETPSATPSGKIASPSASVSPTVKKTGLSIRILNGSGEKGVASEAKKFLEEKGYTVVSTGNADAFDYEETEINIKEEKASQLDTLKANVSEKYTVGSTTSDLKSDTAYDAQIIIGKQ